MLRNLNVMTVGYAIDWTTNGTDNGAVAKSLISWLCSEYEDEFLDVATEEGLPTSRSKKMDANFWTAMSKACYCDTSNQRKSEYLYVLPRWRTSIGSRKRDLGSR
jgi:hypothetical protein